MILSVIFWDDYYLRETDSLYYQTCLWYQITFGVRILAVLKFLRPDDGDDIDSGDRLRAVRIMFGECETLERTEPCNFSVDSILSLIVCQFIMGKRYKKQ